MHRSSTRSRTIHQSSWSFEYLMWIFTRVSGLTLVILAIIGAIGAFTLGAHGSVDLQTLWRWMFFPNTYHVSSSDISDIEAWASAWWQAMQLLIIFFGATHAFNGLRVVIEDFIGHTFVVVLLRSLISILWLAIMLIAVFVIIQA